MQAAAEALNLNPGFCLIRYCRHLEIISNFWTRSLAFALCTELWKWQSQSWSGAFGVRGAEDKVTLRRWRHQRAATYLMSLDREGGNACSTGKGPLFSRKVDTSNFSLLQASLWRHFWKRFPLYKKGGVEFPKKVFNKRLPCGITRPIKNDNVQMSLTYMPVNLQILQGDVSWLQVTQPLVLWSTSTIPF